jgi:hypothetical protein
MNINENINENNTWDCCDPCAIIVLLLSNTLTLKTNDMILHTLDNHGWLDENQKMDLAAAQKELGRAQKLSQQNQVTDHLNQ